MGDRNVISLSPSSPVFEKHTIYGGNSNEVDPYGGFPVRCPNGSGYSIKLGSTEAGGQAEGVSYEFTIPSNDNSYSLIYHYAVVFQSPNHRINEQPRMEIEVTNVTDNVTIECASFSFIALGSSLPGFQTSTASDTLPVLYKDWSAVSVDLSGNAGKTIRLFFKTADCTFRRHFGYAYIDVGSECGGSFVGATYCPDDSLINVTAPFGYKGYTWYDNSMTNVLGSQQVLTLSPPPPSGTTVAVKLEPYDGYGCPKTLTARLMDTLTISASAGDDSLSCNRAAVQIGGPPKQGLLYRWSPPEGLNDPNIANPVAAPDRTTSYVLTATTSGGGCRITDTVVVRSSLINDSLQFYGKNAFCFGSGDSAVLQVNPANTIQWYRNGLPVTGARQTRYRASMGGTYHAMLSNDIGCSITTRTQSVIIDIAKPGIAYPTEYAVVNVPLPLQARSIGENITWLPAINLNNTTSFTPVFKGPSDQSYTIHIQTSTGCLTVDTLLVKTIKEVKAYVPTAFTPNRDGKNDYLRPVLLGIKELRFFRVFNRWGHLLYETRSAQPGWDGTFKGSPQTTQAVVWMLEGVGVDGATHTLKGTTVLLR